jgi:hypothetical protein
MQYNWLIGGLRHMYGFMRHVWTVLMYFPLVGQSEQPASGYIQVIQCRWNLVILKWLMLNLKAVPNHQITD